MTATATNGTVDLGLASLGFNGQVYAGHQLLVQLSGQAPAALADDLVALKASLSALVGADISQIRVVVGPYIACTNDQSAQARRLLLSDRCRDWAGSISVLVAGDQLPVQTTADVNTAQLASGMRLLQRQVQPVTPHCQE